MGKDKRITITVTRLGLATILAGLRLVQNPRANVEEIATNAGEYARPMDDSAIDELCERLNTGFSK